MNDESAIVVDLEEPYVVYVVGVTSPPAAASSIPQSPTTMSLSALATPAEGEQPSTSGTQQLPMAASGPRCSACWMGTARIVQ